MPLWRIGFEPGKVFCKISVTPLRIVGSHSETIAATSILCANFPTGFLVGYPFSSIRTTPASKIFARSAIFSTSGALRASSPIISSLIRSSRSNTVPTREVLELTHGSLMIAYAKETGSPLFDCAYEAITFSQTSPSKDKTPEIVCSLVRSSNFNTALSEASIHAGPFSLSFAMQTATLSEPTSATVTTFCPRLANTPRNISRL